MAKNSGSGSRRGAVRSRSQFKAAGGWVKRDAGSGRILDRKADSAPFKGVRREK